MMGAETGHKKTRSYRIGPDIGMVIGQVSAIELKNWIPTLTLDLEPGIKLPANATRKKK